MVSPPRRERLDLLIVAMLFVGQSLGNEYMMTCSRPVASKTPRVLRLDLGLPCDLSVESWCNLPGDKYPWHAVRSFVFENQGLMRRMYGEVRQLSVLRMEFNGNSIDENSSVGREFDELFKPVSPTTTTSTTTTTTRPPTTHKTTSTSTSMSTDTATTETAQKTTISSSSSSSPSSSSSSSPSTFSTSAESLSSSSSSPHSSNKNFDYDHLNSSDSSDSDYNVHSDKNNRSVSGSGSANNNNNNNNSIRNDMSDGSSSGESVIKSAASPVPAADYNNDYLSDQPQTTTEESGQTEGTTLFEQRDVDETAEVTTEPVHILFQDAEKTTTSRTSTSTTTGGGTMSDPAAADDPESPQQVHRSDIKGVNACPVKEEVVAPYWANNTRGEVLALLNLYPFEQYIHWEKCTFEHRQMYCREGCRCEQQYRLHRLLAFDPTNECRGIFSDWFRFPSCCVCKCYLTSSDLAQERVSFNRSPRFDDTDIPDVNGVDDSHFYYKTNNFFNLRQPR